MTRRFLNLIEVAFPNEEESAIPDKGLLNFAELIVLECIEVVLDSEPSPGMVPGEPFSTIAENIKRHFKI